jgi:hypothetical protein
LAWLSKLKPKEDLDRLYKNWNAETGKWFLDSDEVQEWFHSDKTCLLWCHGSGTSPTHQTPVSFLLLTL